MWEETGLTVDGLTLVGLCSGPGHHHVLDNGDEIYAVTAVFVAHRYAGELSARDPETLALRFWAPDRLPADLRQGSDRFVEQFRRWLAEPAEKRPAYSHRPEGYRCPFCAVARGEHHAGLRTLQQDVVWRDSRVTAFVASHWWPCNAGHVLVVPNRHFENVYDLPASLGADIQAVTQRLAHAFKAVYGCDGVSTRQHNEPAGGQDVWHYHVHVFPRYRADELYLGRRRETTREERAPYAAKLRPWLEAADASGLACST